MTIAYLLIDLPSDHEVEWALSTECDTIRGILTNKGARLRSKVKHVRATKLGALFDCAPRKPYDHVRYVHLACHAGDDGIDLLGGKATWKELAKLLTRYVSPLRAQQRRVLCLSCCHSKAGVQKMQRWLAKHFTAVYYLTEHRVGFDTSMVVWTMFYYRKSLDAPLAKAKERINEFFDNQPIEIRYYDKSAAPAKASPPTRRSGRKLRPRRPS